MRASLKAHSTSHRPQNKLGDIDLPCGPVSAQSEDVISAVSLRVWAVRPDPNHSPGCHTCEAGRCTRPLAGPGSPRNPER